MGKQRERNRIKSRVDELPQDARTMAQAGLKVMQANQGALQRLLEGLGKLLNH